MRRLLNTLNRNLYWLELILWVGSILIFSYSQMAFGITMNTLAVLYFITAFSGRPAERTAETFTHRYTRIGASVMTIAFLFHYIGTNNAQELMWIPTIIFPLMLIVRGLFFSRQHSWKDPEMIRLVIYLVLVVGFWVEIT